MNKKWNTKMLVEGGILIALTVILSYITIYRAPNGGSVTAGSMIPIMLLAIRWGIGPGMIVGGTYGIINFLLKPVFYHPIQFLLDYPLAFALLGLAGVGYMSSKKDNSGYFRLVLGIILAIGGRMLCHVLSGVVFFSSNIGDQNAWVYSIFYNMTYLIPELILSIVILAFIWKPIRSIMRS